MVTPLRDGGETLDDRAFPALVDHLAGAGLDGILVFGTNGEGLLLSVEERRLGLRLFLESSAGRLRVAAHCGAQTTAETVGLAEDAALAGADAVAVVAPPFFDLSEREQFDHFAAAAAACAPLPFYVYEFARRSGYPVSVDALRRLRERADNFVGMKVSDAPWDAFAPYLGVGVDIFVGPEGLIARGLEVGAVGAMSALASAFPAEVVAVVRAPTEASAERLATLRAGLNRFAAPAACKRVLAAAGVPIGPDVRAPLRDLVPSEVEALVGWLGSL